MKKRERSAVLRFLSDIYSVIVASFMPFIVRTVLVHYIGIEYVGVSSLFTSVLQVLNVADFGLTTALAYYLYKPAEENDIQTVNAYMGYFRRLFHIVGLIILIAGLMLIPILPLLVKGKEYPADLNIYVIYIAYILQTALYYLTNMYISTLLCAYLKSHISSLISGTSLLIMYGSQILTICILRNYYLFTFELLFTVLIQNLFFYWVRKRHFPWLNFSEKMEESIKKDFHNRMFSMILSKIRNVSRNSFDCIIVSLFFGLTILAEYQNYYQVMIVPYMINIIIRQAIQPALGNGIAAETMESNYGILKQYVFVNNLISTICTTSLLSLIQPFMKLWMGTDYLLGMDVVICIAVYYYTLTLSEGSILLRESTGIWSEGRWISVVEAVSNVILNVLFAKTMGLYGIIFATIITVGFINVPLESYYAIKGYFIGKYGDYLMRLVKYTVETLIIVCISVYICFRIEVTNYGMMALRILISVLLPAIMFILIHVRDDEMRTLIDLGNRIRIRILRRMQGVDV